MERDIPPNFLSHLRGDAGSIKLSLNLSNLYFAKDLYDESQIKTSETVCASGHTDTSRDYPGAKATSFSLILQVTSPKTSTCSAQSFIQRFRRRGVN
jgi:hypothetical protein